MMRPFAVLMGVLVALAFSVWPLRLLNGPCCFGAVLAGSVGAALAARGQGGVLEVSEGVKIGALVGLLAGVIAVVLNVLLEDVAPFGPVPTYMLAFAEATWESFAGIAEAGEGTTTYEPTLWQAIILVPLGSLVAAAVGGVFAASFFPDGDAQPPRRAA